MSPTQTAAHDLVVIGASWGGLQALRCILGGLPADLGAAVVVVQHRSADSHPSALRDLLAAVATLRVCDVDDKRVLAPGHVYMAPPDFHTLVDGDHLELTTEAAVTHSRPSIDVLFETAAESYRDRCIGVVLTGANADGAAGLARIVELGGAALVQDPDTAERPEMPRAAIEAVPSATIVPLDAIAGAVVELRAERGVQA